MVVKAHNSKLDNFAFADCANLSFEGSGAVEWRRCGVCCVMCVLEMG